MSIILIRKKMHGWFKWVMFAIAFMMVVGFFGLGFGNQLLGKGGDNSFGFGASKDVAKVNGMGISRTRLDNAVQNQLDMMKDQGMQANPTALEISVMRGQLLDRMIDSATLAAEAKKEGIKISGSDLNKELDNQVDQKLMSVRAQFVGNAQGPKADDQLDEALKRQGTSLYKVKKGFRDSLDKDSTWQRLMIIKMADKWKAGVNVSEQAFRSSYDEVRFSQITISDKTRSDAQAKSQAEDLVKKLRGGEDFAAAAKQYSEDPFKDKGGKRDFPMTRSMTDPKLGDVVFSMKPGDISDPVKMDLGYTIIKLDSRTSKLPKDFDDQKKRAEYWEKFKKDEQDRVLGDRAAEIRKDMKIDVYDPELKAYRAINDSTNLTPPERKSLIIDAVAGLKHYADGNSGDTNLVGRVYCEMAMAYDQLQSMATLPQEKTDYIAKTKDAIDQALRYTEDKDVRFMAASLAITEKDWNKAVENLDMVSQTAYDDPQTHYQLLGMYKKIKAPGNAKVAEGMKREQQWMADYTVKMKEAQKRQQEAAAAKAAQQNRNAAPPAQGPGPQAPPVNKP